jgi:predicted MFS family arabinose efflux permease
MPLVVYILGLAIFSIGTSELMVAGMMTTCRTILISPLVRLVI